MFVNTIQDKRLLLIILDGPIAPDGKPLALDPYGLYNPELFTVPRPKYVTGSGHSKRLDQLLDNPSTQKLATLDAEATVELPDIQRPNKVVTVGFFEQGILTGLILALTTVVAGTGVAGYYLVGYLRTRNH